MSVKGEPQQVSARCRDLPRIVIISTMVPPSATGQARVLSHLIGSPPPENHLLLTENFPFSHEIPERAHANYRIFSQLRLRLREEGWLEQRMPQLNLLGGILPAVLTRAREVSRHISDFNAAILIACTASPFDLPASTLVALRRRLPLITYLFDDPIFQWAPGPLRNFARLWEPIWSRVAAQVIVPNEAMAEEFFRRRRRKPVIIRNPVAPEAFVSSGRPWPAVQGHRRIVYTGSVYQAQSDAFKNLLEALKELTEWSLHIYTSQSDAQLAAYGIQGPNVFRHPHVDQDESYAQQRLADVLFLPLAFRSAIQEVLRTSAPMKMGEYLASGRPILVHAPPGTFVARHMREHRAGLIVDTPCSRSLASALGELSSKPRLRHSLHANALRLAEIYRVGPARELFWNTVKAAIQKSSC